jgi:protein-tyrosine phosphatase
LLFITFVRKLKSGLLFRSARPDEASTEDRRRLKDDYHIHTIIDLRTKSEHIVQAQKRSVSIPSAEPVAPSNNQAAEPVKIPGLNYAEINFNGSSYSFAPPTEILVCRQTHWSYGCWIPHPSN